MYEEPVLLGTHDAISGASRSWFVYLFALTDCSGFKVGFSCNPLQRIHTFSRRYFERFDVYQSWLLELDAEADARAVEATLKTELAEFRSEAPVWVPMEAGGHTEWFSAVHFATAEERLRSFQRVLEIARLGSASDFFRSELGRVSASFESWAVSQAHFVGGRVSSVRELRGSIDAARSLRDWLDAYRYFDLPLFVDDPAVLQFVRAAATTN
jgi:hypothetical protein